ncbi:hypothetical protein MMC30_005480 [Trapelia coarctata]|nr:hypothetical protein [Trapelia coarctata]
MQLPSIPHPLRAVLPTRNPSLSPSTSDTVTLVDTPPAYGSVVPRLHRAPRKHGTLSSYKLGPIVYPARTVVTLLALITSAALIGTTSQALRDYSSATNAASSDPESIDYDLRATKLTLACGVYIAVGTLGFLVTALALWRSNKPEHPPTRHRLFHPTLFTLVTLPALFLALFTLAYNISTSSASSTTSFGSPTPALNYASCYYSSLAFPPAPLSAATSVPSDDPNIFSSTRRLARSTSADAPSDGSQPARADAVDTDALEGIFAGICAESRVSQVLLLMLVMLEIGGSVVVGWGWWAILRGMGKRSNGGDEREGRRGRQARQEKRRVRKGSERV